MSTQATGPELRPVATGGSNAEAPKTEMPRERPAIVIQQGMGSGASSLESHNTHSSERPKASSFLDDEEEEIEPKDRFCEFLTCLESCLPESIVDYIDQLCLTVYNCIAPLLGLKSADKADADPEAFRSESIVFGVYSDYGPTTIRLVNGNSYKFIDKLKSPIDWMAKRVLIEEDQETRNEVIQAAKEHTFSLTPSLSCKNLSTGEIVRVKPSGYFRVDENDLKRKGPERLVTTVLEIKPVSSLDPLPLLKTEAGHVYHVQGNIDASKWPVDHQIVIHDDEQTAQDGTQICDNIGNGERVRLRHFLNLGS